MATAIRFQVMDPADIPVGTANLAYPRTARSILSRLWIDPDIMNPRFAKRKSVHPFENIVTSCRRPSLYICFSCAGGNGIAQIQAAMPA